MASVSDTSNLHMSATELYSDILHRHVAKRKISTRPDIDASQSSNGEAMPSPSKLRRAITTGEAMPSPSKQNPDHSIPQHLGSHAFPVYSSEGKVLGTTVLGQSRNSKEAMSLNAFPAEPKSRSRASKSPEPLGFQEDAQRQPELQQNQLLATTQVPSPLGEVPVTATVKEKSGSISEEDDDDLTEPREKGAEAASPGRTPTGAGENNMDEDDEQQQEAKRSRQGQVQQQPDLHTQQMMILQNIGGKSPEEILAALSHLQSLHMPDPQIPEPAQWMSDTLEKQAARFEKSMQTQTAQMSTMMENCTAPLLAKVTSLAAGMSNLQSQQAAFKSDVDAVKQDVKIVKDKFTAQDAMNAKFELAIKLLQDQVASGAAHGSTTAGSSSGSPDHAGVFGNASRNNNRAFTPKYGQGICGNFMRIPTGAAKDWFRTELGKLATAEPTLAGIEILEMEAAEPRTSWLFVQFKPLGLMCSRETFLAFRDIAEKHRLKMPKGETFWCAVCRGDKNNRDDDEPYAKALNLFRRYLHELRRDGNIPTRFSQYGAMVNAISGKYKPKAAACVEWKGEIIANIKDDQIVLVDDSILEPAIKDMLESVATGTGHSFTVADFKQRWNTFS